MDSTVTLESLHEELKSLKVQFIDLETRIMAVEKKAADDKKELREEMSAVHKTLNEVKSTVANLESLEDANFMAVTHMLSVIARKLKIPPRDLKTGNRGSK